MAKLLAKLAASAALWAPLKASSSAQVNVAPAPAVVVGRGEDEEPLAEPGWATSSSEGVGGTGACRLTVFAPQGPRPSAGRSGGAAVVSGPCGLDRPVREAILRQEGLLGDAPTSTSEASGLALGGSSSIRQRSVVPSEATAATGPRSGSEVFDSAGEEPLESEDWLSLRSEW
uniref:Putative secreted protein n=1 Tax=Ixodes ricinus TaxID=34613 RepID=A0A6B0UYC2_IXORI